MVRRDTLGLGLRLLGLLGIAAMPLPQTPALIFTALLPLPASEVFFALFLGNMASTLGLLPSFHPRFNALLVR